MVKGHESSLNCPSPQPRDLILRRLPLPVDHYLSFPSPLPPPSRRACVSRSTCRARLRYVHQTSFKTSYLSPGAVPQETQQANDYLQHRVHSLLRNRDHTFRRPFILASGVEERGYVHVHDLDGNDVHRPIRELYCMERECYQLGAGVV